ncbi:MAG: hypothetical protein Q8L23_15775 [Caulobacter sp.]|nr:hypothetical protein [Caulobacter sp.]
MLQFSAHPGGSRDLPLAPDPNEARRPTAAHNPPLTPAPAPAVQPDLTTRRDVSIHWTLFTPGIPATARLGDPCRWATLYGATPVQAMRHVLERTGRRPWDLSARDDTDAGEVRLYLSDPTAPEAIVVDGLTAADCRAALDQLRRQQTMGAGR